MITINKPDLYICPDCGHSIEPIQNPFKPGSWIKLHTCTECTERNRKDEERVNILRTLDRMKIGLDSLLIGRGFSPLQIQEADLNQVPLKLRSILDTSSYLYGTVGSGKTCAITAATKKYIDELFANAQADCVIPSLDSLPHFADVSTLLRRLHFSIMGKGEDGETYDALLRLFSRCPLLILDDIGARRSTEFSEDCLFEIVDERVNFMRPTFFTSNFSLAQLAGRINPRTVSRIAGMCRGRVFQLNGPDRRLQ